MPSRGRLQAIAGAALALFLSPSAMRATVIVWADAGTTYSTGSNWVGGVAPANSLTTDIASFGTVNTFQPDLTGNRSVNGVQFTAASTVTFGSASAKTLTIGSAGIDNSSTSGTKTMSLKLSLGAAQSFTNSGTLTISGTVANGGNLLTLAGTSASGTISGVISGTGGLTKAGTGTWTLSGVNTYSGATTINAGTLLSGASNVLPGTAVTINSTTAGATATLDLNGFSDTIGALTFGGAGATSTSTNTVTTGAGTLTLGGNVTYSATNNPLGATISGNLALGAATRTFTVGDSTSATDDLTVSAIISGAGVGLTKAGTGALTLSGANTYTGTTTLSAGTLNINNAAATGTGTLTINGGTIDNTSGSALTLSNNNAVTLGANLVFTGTSDLNVGTGAFSLGGASRTLTINGGTLAVGGVIVDGAGIRGLTKDGAGILALSGANTYSGVTTINAGTLSVNSLANGGAASAVGDSSNAAGNLVLNGGTLQYTGAGSSSNRLFTLGTSGGTIDASGSGALNLTNAGTVTLSGTNTARTFTLTGASTGANTLTAVVGDNGTGATSLTKDGVGTWVLSGANTYTGATSINAGALQLGASDRLSNSTAVTVASGATFDLADYSETIASLAGAGTVQTTGASNNTLTVGDGASTTFSGVIQNTGAGNLSLTKQGAGTLTLSGSTSSYGGVTTINAGALSVGAFANGGANSSIGASSNAAGNLVLSGGTLQYTGSSAQSTDRLFTLGTSGGTIDASGTGGGTLSLTNTGSMATTGTGTRTLTLTGANTGSNTLATVIVDQGANATSLTKSGAGAWVLSGASTYTGATTVSAGTLNIQNASALGSATGSTTVSSGGALEIQGGTTVIGEGLTINGAGVSSNGALRNVSGSNVWRGDVTLAAASTITSSAGTLTFSNTARTNKVNLAGYTLTVEGSGDTVFYSQVGQTGADTGSFVKNGSGTTTFLGQLNTYTGATTINDGKLILDTFVTNPNQGIQGNVVIGDGSGAADSARLQLGPDVSPIAYELISDSATITINSDGLFDLNRQYETIGGLTLNNGGHVSIGTGAGTLYLGGNVTTTASASQTALIEGYQFSLTGADRTFTVDNGGATSDLTVSANVFNGGIIKAGAGTMTLTGTNTYDGATTINAGVVNIQNASALGSTTNGTSVTAAGAALELQHATGMTITGETLTLNGDGVSSGGALRNISGDNTWTGNVVLGSASRINSDSGTLTFSGTFSGSQTLTVGGSGNTAISGGLGIGALTKADGGTLTLSGSNTYTGATTINGGTLLLGSSERLSNSTAVTVGASGTLNLGNNTETVASIAGSGSIVVGTGQLIAGDSTNTTFSGTMSGAGVFTKQGSGQLTFTSNLGFGGDLNLNAGTIEFDANNAFTGNMTILAGTTLKLSNANISLNNLTLSGTGAITIDFGGTASILNVLGTLNIGAGITVTITNWQDATDYFFAQNWTGAIFDTGGIAPMNQVTFNPPTYTNNQTKWISYDHQIAPVPEPSTYGAILLGLAGAFLGYRRWRCVGAPA